MKLRATITIDTEAKDFQEAARVQQELDELCQQLSEKHTKVTFDIRERRNVKGRSEGQPGTRAKSTQNKKPTSQYGGGGGRSKNHQAAE